MHFIPIGHWYPEEGSKEQYVSGMARLLIVMSLETKIIIEEAISSYSTYFGSVVLTVTQ